MQTRFLKADAPGAVEAVAAILQDGGLVGIPTETGLWLGGKCVGWNGGC
ncbi:hypothetical protein [Anaeromassilibacillus sp. SJQ-1]